jgi:hypothetical protein
MLQLRPSRLRFRIFRSFEKTPLLGIRVIIPFYRVFLASRRYSVLGSESFDGHTDPRASVSRASLGAASFYLRNRRFGLRWRWVEAAERRSLGRAVRLDLRTLNAGKAVAGAEVPAFRTPASAEPSGEPSPLAASHPGPAS